MPQPTYYEVLGLDPRASSPDLAQQLTHQLTQAPPGPGRQYIEQARAVLCDEGKRRHYDARLNDPQAPAWTPNELHELALTAPTPARTGLVAAFAETRVKVLSGVVAGLALILAIAVTAVACSGSDGGLSPTASDGSVQSSAQTSGDSDQVCRPARGRAVWNAEWEKEKRPDYLLKLTAQTDLPSEVAQKLSNPRLASGLKFMTQYQDKTIGVGEVNSTIGGPAVYVAQYDADGALVKLHTIRQQSDTTAMPTPFDQAEDISGGYMRVQADGVEIPSEANGVEATQQYVVNALPDAFDRSKVWVLLRGGTKLYRGTLYANAPDSGC
ncbi:hypothetical protein [Dietzia timorensis]|uniref:J domain-containing protein n=1 Tax=Dietzia timorensis TaxID=499555 RepID=A0A173LIF9_9ACTN|nr:hypothetical protein [Dietzia timorensis]ANI91221.1 Hypothetical protein BJL86_0411 [Dietzia timorensis]